MVKYDSCMIFYNYKKKIRILFIFSIFKERVRRYFEVGICVWLEKNENENWD